MANAVDTQGQQAFESSFFLAHWFTVGADEDDSCTEWNVRVEFRCLDSRAELILVPHQENGDTCRYESSSNNNTIACTDPDGGLFFCLSAPRKFFGRADGGSLQYSR